MKMYMTAAAVMGDSPNIGRTYFQGVLNQTQQTGRIYIKGIINKK